MEAMSETEISVQFQVIGRWRTLCHMVRDDGTGEWRVEQKLSERQGRMHHRHAQGLGLSVRNPGAWVGAYGSTPPGHSSDVPIVGGSGDKWSFPGSFVVSKSKLSPILDRLVNAGETSVKLDTLETAIGRL